ncbi:hypothetical protein ACX93W_24505 [Paenibacillus sp. CAU 1782]
MIKAFVTSILLASFIFLSACGLNATPPVKADAAARNPDTADGSFSQTTPTSNASTVPAQSEKSEADSVEPDHQSFVAELAFDLNSIEDQLTENERPALEVLQNNLNALVNHDHAAFKSGFVSEELAEALDFYYGDHLQYRFTELEQFERHSYIENQVHFTIAGERLDTTTDTIEQERLMYAIRQDDQGKWTIYTID